MALFTLVLDYRGGTYISQVRSANLETLLTNIDSAVDWEGLQSLGVVSASRKVRARFAEEVAAHGAVPLEGLLNAWCVSARLGRFMAIVNVIKISKLH